jgi:hypothetical protein
MQIFLPQRVTWEAVQQTKKQKGENMKFLKTKFYLYKITGRGTGIVRDKPLNAKMDGKIILDSYKVAYQGWGVERGSKLLAMTAGNRMVWEVI